MNKATYYGVFIICTTLVILGYLSYTERIIEKRKPTERIVYTMPLETNYHQKVYKLDEETFAIIIDIPKTKKGKK
jgi:hypothetical protein